MAWQAPAVRARPGTTMEVTAAGHRSGRRVRLGLRADRVGASHDQLPGQRGRIHQFPALEADDLGRLCQALLLRLADPDVDLLRLAQFFHAAYLVGPV